MDLKPQVNNEAETLSESSAISNCNQISGCCTRQGCISSNRMERGVVLPDVMEVCSLPQTTFTPCPLHFYSSALDVISSCTIPSNIPNSSARKRCSKKYKCEKKVCVHFIVVLTLVSRRSSTVKHVHTYMCVHADDVIHQ